MVKRHLVSWFRTSSRRARARGRADVPDGGHGGPKDLVATLCFRESLLSYSEQTVAFLWLVERPGGRYSVCALCEYGHFFDPGG